MLQSVRSIEWQEGLDFGNVLIVLMILLNRRIEIKAQKVESVVPMNEF